MSSGVCIAGGGGEGHPIAPSTSPADAARRSIRAAPAPADVGRTLAWQPTSGAEATEWANFGGALLGVDGTTLLVEWCEMCGRWRVLKLDRRPFGVFRPGVMRGPSGLNEWRGLDGPRAWGTRGRSNGLR